jgi:hypothetical protein
MSSLDHVVLNITPNSVLWTKQCAHVDVGMFVNQIRSVSKSMVD